MIVKGAIAAANNEIERMLGIHEFFARSGIAESEY
jgi:hypothetical protein